MCLRNKDVARSWCDSSWPFDNVASKGGGSWLRVVTEPSVVHEDGIDGRLVTELHLNDCLHGSLDIIGSHLCSLVKLVVLHLHDNPSLCGSLEKIRFACFPSLEQVHS